MVFWYLSFMVSEITLVSKIWHMDYSDTMSSTTSVPTVNIMVLPSNAPKFHQLKIFSQNIKTEEILPKIVSEGQNH